MNAGNTDQKKLQQMLASHKKVDYRIYFTQEDIGPKRSDSIQSTLIPRSYPTFLRHFNVTIALQPQPGATWKAQCIKKGNISLSPRKNPVLKWFFSVMKDWFQLSWKGAAWMVVEFSSPNNKTLRVLFCSMHLPVLNNEPDLGALYRRECLHHVLNNLNIIQRDNNCQAVFYGGDLNIRSTEEFSTLFNSGSDSLPNNFWHQELQSMNKDPPSFKAKSLNCNSDRQWITQKKSTPDHIIYYGGKDQSKYQLEHNFYPPLCLVEPSDHNGRVSYFTLKKKKT